MLIQNESCILQEIIAADFYYSIILSATWTILYCQVCFRNKWDYFYKTQKSGQPGAPKASFQVIYGHFLLSNIQISRCVCCHW